jgi:hypothetical protein
MPAQVPSLEEILAELEATNGAKRIEGAKSLEEWARTWGMCPNRTRRIIKYAIVVGKMIATSEPRPSILRPGVLYATPVYAFKDQP